MLLALVVICRAVLSGESGRALARIVREVIHARALVLARVLFGRAEGNLGLAVLTLEAVDALATVGAHFIYAGGVVYALVATAVVVVDLAPDARETERALAPGVRNLKFKGIIFLRDNMTQMGAFMSCRIPVQEKTYVNLPASMTLHFPSFAHGFP